MPTADTPLTPEAVSTLHAFDTAEIAAITLSRTVEAHLLEGLSQRGAASLVVSGGSSPQRLYEHLSGRDLDWSRVTVVLADERWVDPGEAGSNETFVRNTLLKGAAAAARFVGLKTPAARPAEALPALETELTSTPHPFDAVIVGMGTDGHTLSWFPEADGLDAALATDKGLAATIRAKPSPVTGPYLDRVTLTRRALAGARCCALLISGDAKRDVFTLAASPGRVEAMPVRALIHDPALNLQTYWWP